MISLTTPSILSIHHLPTWVSSSSSIRFYGRALPDSHSQSSFSLEASHQHHRQHENIAGASSHTAWRDFAEHVSGEWDGYGAEFSSHGVPFELPSSVVPEAFHEWDVKIYDWQTQSPTLAETTQRTMKYKIIRLLPTVGCEADAATPYSIDERVIRDKDADSTTLGFHINGSYVTVFTRELRQIEEFGSNRHQILEVEHCLMGDGDPPSRVRMFLRIVKESEGKERFDPVLKKIIVQREKWVSEFKNGEFLGGCSTSESAFASTHPLQISELEGTWHSENYSSKWEPYRDTFQQLTHEGTEVLERVFEENCIALPTGLWCEFKSTNNNQIFTGAGWLVNPTTAFTLKCEFVEGGKLKRVFFRSLKRHKEAT